MTKVEKFSLCWIILNGDTVHYIQHKKEKQLFLKLLIVAYCQMQHHGDTWASQGALILLNVEGSFGLKMQWLFDETELWKSGLLMLPFVHHSWQLVSVYWCAFLGPTLLRLVKKGNYFVLVWNIILTNVLCINCPVTRTAGYFYYIWMKKKFYCVALCSFFSREIRCQCCNYWTSCLRSIGIPCYQWCTFVALCN